MKDAQLVVDGGIGDGRRLQPIAQRLVIELDLARRTRRLFAMDVPIVDQVLEVLGHGQARSLARSTPPAPK
jgi:hypothetical protein